MKSLIKVVILGGLAFLFGNMTFKLIGGIVAVVALFILILIGVGIKKLFKRNIV